MGLVEELDRGQPTDRAEGLVVPAEAEAGEAEHRTGFDCTEL
jgi:hypothetical protein